MHKHDIIRTTTVAAKRFSFDMQRRLTEFERTLPRSPHTDTGDCVARFQTVQGSLVTGLFHSSKLVLAAKR